MSAQHSPEIHKWVAGQLTSGVHRDYVLKSLTNAGWEAAESEKLLSLHEWVAEQARKGCPRQDLHASIVNAGWTGETVDCVLLHHYPTAPPRTMTTIEMRSFEDSSKVHVEVDQDDHNARSGGFGLVCRVEGLDGFLAKRLEVRPPVPPGQAKKYLAHVRLAKARLGTARKTETRRIVQQFLDEILNNSLSTHFSYEEGGDGLVTAVWFLLPRASGKDLSEHFRDDRRNPPDEDERIAIATAFAQRMRTLRRPGLVHMDCTVDNIRVDRNTRQLVMIDLDGCGIERQSAGAPQPRSKRDEWDVEPMTLGKQDKLIRVPPWYPQEGINCGPNTGNYKFGERWVALDTVIQILSWGTLNVLGWLEPSVRNDLSGRYSKVAEELAPLMTDASSPDLLSAWTSSHSTHMNDCARKYRPLPEFTAEDARNRGCPPCLVYFANLAQDAYLEPRVLSGQPDETGQPRSLYADFSTVLMGGTP